MTRHPFCFWLEAEIFLQEAQFVKSLLVIIGGIYDKRDVIYLPIIPWRSHWISLLNPSIPSDGGLDFS